MTITEAKKAIREGLEVEILTTIIEEYGRIKEDFSFENLAVLIRGKQAAKILKAISNIEPDKPDSEDESTWIFSKSSIAKELKDIAKDRKEQEELERYLLSLKGLRQGFWTFSKKLEELRDFEFEFQKQELSRKLAESKKTAEELQISFGEALERIRNLIYGNKSEIPCSSPEVLAKLEAKKTRMCTLPTGGQKLNAALGGGFKSGQLIVVAAQPGGGKTSFVLHFLSHQLENLRDKIGAAVFSLEIDNDEVLSHLITLRAGVNREQGRIHFYEEYEAVEKETRDKLNAAKQIFAEDIKLNIFDKSFTSLGQITQWITRLKKQRDLKLVIVDYLQLIEPDENIPETEVMARRLSDITRQLKKLSLTLDICIICLSQLNRNSTTRRKTEETPAAEPILSDLKGSGSIEQDADVILFLYENETGTTLKIAKNRRGKTCEIPYKFDKDKGTFKEA